MHTLISALWFASFSCVCVFIPWYEDRKKTSGMYLTGEQNWLHYSHNEWTNKMVSKIEKRTENKIKGCVMMMTYLEKTERDEERSSIPW